MDGITQVDLVWTIDQNSLPTKLYTILYNPYDSASKYTAREAYLKTLHFNCHDNTMSYEFSVGGLLTVIPKSNLWTTLSSAKAAGTKLLLGDTDTVIAHETET